MQRTFGLGVFRGVLILGVLLAACSKPPQELHNSAPASTTHPTIVFMTDFGTANDAVAICKAVMLSIDPDARIMDITHQVTPFSIEEGARFLNGVTPYYPAGTVFVVVIDPGVGTSRKAVIVKTKKGQYFVLPDNGLISPVVDRDGLESAREVTNPGWMIGDKVSSTFHGRDIFSPAGAHLAAGWDYTLAGPEVPELVRLTPKVANVTDKGIDGQVIGLDDPFGSLITDIPGDDFKKLGYALGDKVTVQLDKKPFTLPYAKTFMDVPVGDPLLYVDSRGRIGLAINQGNFSQMHKVTPPVSLFIPKKGGPLKGK
ncbi:MAG TPA: SAM-dependent chlorinase/fluorinase [Candidatus Sulfotelmatobacter sp.]|nr:SAM-dependent chlorinase/fluorinase [Verrucomicrobiae bacterium]HUN60477.1 SAM-dependent chlorinase/fluorinase [Candidatus Sulfotelmatobacter sp.]